MSETGTSFRKTTTLLGVLSSPVVRGGDVSIYTEVAGGG